MPTFLKDVIFPPLSLSAKTIETIKWLHVNIVYEIWCLYTSAKWGGNATNHLNVSTIIAHHLNNELAVLQQISRSTNKRLKSTLNFLKKL
ncbi:2403_t:CDS:2 [Scutellospora calospora]|uniref:2403_t:CDS:1 n=1 Tax=Scutellospora calospora TaxID=85575 RepID=A0ACA9M7G4_9GLOM|nr:2403_t:CDS:2 [Scutellospora calospora]